MKYLDKIWIMTMFFIVLGTMILLNGYGDGQLRIMIIIYLFAAIIFWLLSIWRDLKEEKKNENNL